MSVKKLHLIALNHLLKCWIACLNIMENLSDSLVRSSSGLLLQNRSSEKEI